MKIRSITLGLPVGAGLDDAVARGGEMLRVLSQAYRDAGYDVQTTRVSLPPLARVISSGQDLPSLARQLDTRLEAAEIGYAALGPIRWSDGSDLAEHLADALPEALAASQRVFGAVETAGAGSVRHEAVLAAAQVIRALAESTELGFGNLRFCALAGCPDGIPFFPAAYHEADVPAFSIALQAADLALAAFRDAESLDEAEANLTRTVEGVIAGLERVALPLERQLDISYRGADPTLAPFPSDDESIGAALEVLGVGRFGAAGTLSAAALVTRALRAVRGRRCGFAGLMLPVLEDSVLARSATNKLFGWEELLLYSSVCGTGLDTVPLPGDVTADELAAMILDVSYLSLALDKPLTCRLFPVPGKQAGEQTTFAFPFFANGGVLAVKGLGSPRLLRRGLAGGSA